jgi:hypothetical protein
MENVSADADVADRLAHTEYDDAMRRCHPETP